MRGNDYLRPADKSVYRCPSLRFMTMKKIKYFIYARKSSVGETQQILSIEGQLGELQKMIQRENLAVVDVYKESRSAHIPNNRPKFDEMMKRLAKGEANGIITWHTNRLSRNPKESGHIQQMLQDGIIASIALPYRQCRSEDNALLFSIETSEANQYSRDLSVNVKRGLKQKYELGYPPSYAQLGYLNTKSIIRGSNKIIEDPERWHIVRKGFDLLLTGAYTVPQILDKLNDTYGLRTRPGNIKGGKPLSRSGIYRMFTNPFYYGVFYRNGIQYQGAYKPMITVEEFDAIQLILGRKGKPRPKHHVFAYTGLMRCGVCGSAITACEKQKRIKSTGELKTYTLYHCTRRKKGAATCTERSYIAVQVLEQLITEELSSYQIHAVFKEWGLTVARANYQNEIEQYQQLIDAQITHEIRLQRELNNLVDLRISGGISEETYFQKKAEKDEQLIRVQARKEGFETKAKNWMEDIENQFNFTIQIVERFQNGDLDTKKEICHDFGWNWVLKEKKLFIDKPEWLEAFKKYKNSVEAVFGRLEPEKIFENKGVNASLELVRPLMCALVDEVRTKPKVTTETTVPSTSQIAA